MSLIISHSLELNYWTYTSDMTSAQNLKRQTQIIIQRYIDLISWSTVLLDLITDILLLSLIDNLVAYRESIVIVQKIDFEFSTEVSVLGYFELKKISFFKMSVCMICSPLESKALNLFWSNLDWTCIMGQDTGARNYFEKVWKPTCILV